MVEIREQLAEEHDLLSWSGNRHVFGFNYAQGNCALKFAALHHWSPAHHSDETCSGSLRVSVAE